MFANVPEHKHCDLVISLKKRHSFNISLNAIESKLVILRYIASYWDKEIKIKTTFRLKCLKGLDFMYKKVY